MRVGGNQPLQAWFDEQPDTRDSASMSLSDKYNSKAAALYRDKIATEAKGKPWNAADSIARNHVPPRPAASVAAARTGGNGGGGGSERFGNGMTREQVNSSKEGYFAGLQANNASRRDDLPPSQGGKYAGFGSTSSSSSGSRGGGGSGGQDLLTDAMTSLGAGWSAFASVCVVCVRTTVQPRVVRFR